MTGVSSHEKDVFWSYMSKVVLWRIKDQLRNQSLWEKIKPIKVQLRALTCIWSKERPYLFFVLFCFVVCSSFSCGYFGIALALINEMNGQESFVSFWLQCIACHNLDPKIHLDAGFCLWQNVSDHIWAVLLRKQDQVRNQKVRKKLNHQVSAVCFKCMPWNNLKYSRS